MPYSTSSPAAVSVAMQLVDRAGTWVGCCLVHCEPFHVNVPPSGANSTSCFDAGSYASLEPGMVAVRDCEPGVTNVTCLLHVAPSHVQVKPSAATVPG